MKKNEEKKKKEDKSRKSRYRVGIIDTSKRCNHIKDCLTGGTHLSSVANLE